ncbi:MAG: sugar transferase [Planctomycetes bacterium]|nr:sugar transferase [Planctomycetota bacterium]
MFRPVITRRLLGLIVADIVAVLAALWVSPALYPFLKGSDVPLLTRYLLSPWWQAAIIVQIYLFYLVDLYETDEELSQAPLAARTAIGVVMMTLILVVIYFFNRRQSRGVILFYAPSAFVCVMGVRLFVRKLRRARGPVRNVMMLCNGKGGHQDMALVRAATDAFHQLKGVVLHRESDAHVDAAVPVIRIDAAADLRRIVEREGVDEMVLASGCEQPPGFVRELIRLSYQGLLLSDPMAYYEKVRGKLPCEHLTDASFLLSHMGRRRALYAKLKRLFDIGAAAIVLVLSLPICLGAAILIKLTSQGPVFFRQERVGLDGKTFTLIKFRTMRENAEAKGGAKWATRDDPRVTAIGKVLRKTRIDELPQLVNVLKGDMSLIGPRPERPVFVEQFEREIPYYSERHAVRPGITGWAQVNQGYAAGTEETKEKLSYDLFYLKNQSLTLDLMVALMTAKRMLRAGGQ